MNEGMYKAMMSELRLLNESLNEVRLAVNRIDGRLKEQRRVVYVPHGIDLEEFAKEHDFKDTLFIRLPLGAPQAVISRPARPQAGPFAERAQSATDPQAQMREMVAKKGAAK